MQKKDIVVFTNGNLFSLVILRHFINLYSQRIVKVVLINGDYKGKKGWVALVNYIKTTSVFYVIYKIWSLFLIIYLKKIHGFCITSVEDLINELDINFIRIPNINDQKLFEDISQLNPNYLISVSCPQLIKKKWLELFHYKCINVHSSLLPEYAGLAPYFWVLANGQKKTGVTVHYITKGFDKGNILEQQSLPISECTSCFNMFIKQCLLGSGLLIKAFKKLEFGDKGKVQNLNLFSYFSHPSTKAYLNLKRRKFSLFQWKDLKKVIQILKEIERTQHFTSNA